MTEFAISTIRALIDDIFDICNAFAKGDKDELWDTIDQASSRAFEAECWLRDLGYAKEFAGA